MLLFASFLQHFAAKIPNRGEGALIYRIFNTHTHTCAKHHVFASKLMQNGIHFPNGGEVGVNCVEFLVGYNFKNILMNLAAFYQILTIVAGIGGFLADYLGA